MPRTRAAAKKARSKPELEFTRPLQPAVSRQQTRSGGPKSALQKKVNESYRQQKKSTSDVSGKKIPEDIEVTTIQDNYENEANNECNLTEGNTLSDFDVGSLTKEEALKQLREFDFTYKYGPSTNITRLQRFERAEMYGLSPPLEIKVILERFMKIDESVNLSIWSTYPL